MLTNGNKKYKCITRREALKISMGAIAGTALSTCGITVSGMISGQVSPVTINLRSGDNGRIFEGIGAVSAGASSRLLYDYEESVRSRILDFLFKPQFGAGFQHLKLEIGGGENSTCGSEPSHVITREELKSPKARGYEFWLMKEARKRNPDIILDCLPWSYPGWITDRFSQDSTDWIIAFLEIARKQYGLEIDWIAAGQNEAGTDRDWIVKSLRPTLDSRGYKNVRIQAPDDASNHWKIFDDLENDPAYRDIVSAVGYHYVNGREPWEIDQISNRDATFKAKTSGKPLWASEEWSMSGKDWDGIGSMFLVRLFNKFYIRDRITKIEYWSPIDSIYEGLPWSDTGVMQADSPWSGHYEVWPGVWAMAHITQFVKPGWQFLDNGCGILEKGTWKGSYVTLKNPATGDWSMIICTGRPISVKVNVEGNLTGGAIHVWKSDALRQFEMQKDIKMAGHEFEIALDPSSIYTITTTTGQRKGSYQIQEAKPFPFPYMDNFESYKVGDLPRYFSDQKGSFEISMDPERGKCLSQIVPQTGILWIYMKKVLKPYTVIGDQSWTDYSISTDVKIAGGDVELGGRFSDQNQLSYRWILTKEGNWKICYQSKTLKEGRIERFNGAEWHNMKLVFKGDRLKGYIDRELLADVTDGSVKNGMAILASSYHNNLFSDFKISPV